MKYKELYDDLYDCGYHSDYKICHTRVLYKLIYKHIPKYSKILDIGCSNGSAVLELKQKDYEMYGIDISEKAIAICRSRKIDHCKTNSITSIDFADNFFDCIISSDVIEHLDPSEIDPALLEIKRVLKFNGYGIVQIATTHEKNRKWDYMAHKHKLKFLHTSVFNSEYWQNKIIGLNLELQSVESIKDRSVILVFKKI